MAAQRHVPIDVPYSSSAPTTRKTPAYVARDARAPEEDEQQRHAERAGDVEPRQHGQPGDPPAGRAGGGGPDERPLAAGCGAARGR